jgi:FdhE protein
MGVAVGIKTAISFNTERGATTMIKSVVSKEYQDLQKEIVSLQEQWKQRIDPEAIRPNLDKAAMAAGVPAAALTAIDFDISLFLQWIEEINSTLLKSNPELETKLASIRGLLNEETAIRWIDEAFSFNHLYFVHFAEENGLEKWIPQFLAETALRPYLQLTAEKVQQSIDRAVPGAGCPVCGEPVRLAVLEEEGKKVIHCPRCHAHWNAKRLECSHCGNEDHQTTKFLTIEGDAVSQIQVCEVCNGYIKIIDTRQYITKPSAAMLDLNSIHLDFVAQENGYQSVGEKKLTN